MSQLVMCVGLLWFAADTARSQEEPSLHAFSLQHASADEVAKTLQVLMPDAVVNVDAQSNLIMVLGTEQEVLQIRDWVKMMDAQPERQLIRVFALSNRLAEEAAQLLTEILNNDPRVGDVSIVPDLMANSLLVRSDEENFDYVEDLLRVIDHDQLLRPRRVVKVFVLQHAVATEAGQLLNEIWADVAQPGVDGEPQFGVAVDERTNSVIVMGENNEILEEVEALLLRLDTGDRHEPRNLDQLQVRVVWIVSADNEQEVTPMPADLEEVAVELKSLGIIEPQVAAQMVVNSSGQFSVSGSALLENPCQIEVAGFVGGESSRPTLEISIAAHEETGAPQGRGGAGQTLCNLETSLMAPIGHFVVLGVSPIGSRGSAFVVQVTPGPQ